MIENNLFLSVDKYRQLPNDDREVEDKNLDKRVRFDSL